MFFSLRAAVPLYDVRSGVSHKDSGSRASVKVKVACEKLTRKSRKLSRKRRRIRRYCDRKNKDTKNMASVGHSPSVVSGAFDTYWQNYYRCLKWTQNHQVSYWKSRVQALEYENTMLRTFLDQTHRTDNLEQLSLHNTYCHKYTGEKSYDDQEMSRELINQEYDRYTSIDREINCNVNDGAVAHNEDGEEFEFEVDNNMIEFFTQSMKHKLALRQERDDSKDYKDACSKNNYASKPWKKMQSSGGKVISKDSEQSFAGKKKVSHSQCISEENIEATDLQDILQRKSDQEDKMNKKLEMYGKGAPKIMGMETAMQLNFKQACSSKRPIEWPVIPLNL